jgi:hypothetical protein
MQKKKKKVLEYDVLVIHVPEDNTVYLYSNSGRLVRPVLTVNKHENDQKTPYKQTINFFEAVKNNLITKQQIQNFQSLKDLGLVSYIDAWEQEAGAMVAQSRNMIDSLSNDIINTITLIQKAKELQSQSEELYISINSKHIKGSLKKTPVYITKKQYMEEIDKKNIELDNMKKKITLDIQNSQYKLVSYRKKLDEYLKPSSEITRLASAIGISENELETYSKVNSKIYNFVKDTMDAKKLEFTSTFKELNRFHINKYKKYLEEVKLIQKESKKTCFPGWPNRSSHCIDLTTDHIPFELYVKNKHTIHTSPSCWAWLSPRQPLTEAAKPTTTPIEIQAWRAYGYRSLRTRQQHNFPLQSQNGGRRFLTAFFFVNKSLFQREHHILKDLFQLIQLTDGTCKLCRGPQPLGERYRAWRSLEHHSYGV